QPAPPTRTLRARSRFAAGTRFAGLVDHLFIDQRNAGRVNGRHRASIETALFGIGDAPVPWSPPRSGVHQPHKMCLMHARTRRGPLQGRWRRTFRAPSRTGDWWCERDSASSSRWARYHSYDSMSMDALEWWGVQPSSVRALVVSKY